MPGVFRCVFSTTRPCTKWTAGQARTSLLFVRYQAGRSAELRAVHADRMSCCLPPVFSEHTGGLDFADDFHGERPKSVCEHVIPVCVPMYNEDASELVSTLRSLHAMSVEMPEYSLEICVILDGWKKVHATVMSALQIIFPNVQDWRARLDEAAGSEPQEKLTLILQRSAAFNLALLATPSVVDFSASSMGADLLGRFLNLTAIVKVDNRKKHNSHDLFFRGFANHLNVKFAFASDCGTLFDPLCLPKIVKVMTKDARCVACTGRQRVMTKWQQPGCEAEGFLGWVLRVVQGFDYEASTVVYNGCFSLFGCLAVIPGPCGLFRLPPLLDRTKGASAFDFYANAAKEAEEHPDMLSGNCILAEDRVLTYAALFLSPGGPWKVKWAKTATFYFQSEVRLQTLVAQRRRWLNGTVAGYLFVMNQLGALCRPGTGFHARLRFIRFLMFLMVLVYVGIACGPAFYMYGGVVSFFYVTEQDFNSLFAFGACAFCASCYAIFFARHHVVAYDPRAFALVAAVNTVTALLMLVALCKALVITHSWVQWTALMYFMLPIMLNALIPDFTALATIMNPLNLVVYLLFMPTMQGYFMTMAIARSFDLSWGNRGGVGGEVEALKVRSQAMMLATCIINVLILVFLFFSSNIQTRADIFLLMFLLAPVGFIGFFSALQASGLWISSVAVIWLVIFFVLNVWYSSICDSLGQQALSATCHLLVGDGAFLRNILLILSVLFSLKTMKACLSAIHSRYRRAESWRATSEQALIQA